MTLKDEYRELLSLTKLYLQTEHSPKEWKICDEETFVFFKERAQKVPVKKPEPVVVKREPPPVVQAPPPAPVIQAPPPVPVVLAPSPVPVAKAPPPVEKKSIDLQPPEKAKCLEFGDIKKTLLEHFPKIQLFAEPPDDRLAKKPSKQSVGDVVILSFDQKVHPFLQNLSLAINQEKRSASVILANRIEGEEGWEKLLRCENLKLIIASDYGLYSLQNVMKYYREVPKQAKYFLGKIPLLLLTDLSLYLKEPKLKPTLWQALSKLLDEIS